MHCNMENGVLEAYVDSIGPDRLCASCPFTESVDIQCSPFITLYLGSTGMDHVIGELFYKGAILQRDYRKMT